MLWKELKSWAKEKGYKANRTKVADQNNEYNYVWSKIDDSAISGTATSVSKLAFALYNHMTNNKYLEYQEEYKIKLSQMEIEHDAGFGFQ